MNTHSADSPNAVTAQTTISTNLDARVSTRSTFASGGNVTVAAYSAGLDPATLVLDAIASSHNTAGSIGAKISNAVHGLRPPSTQRSSRCRTARTGWLPAHQLLGAVTLLTNTRFEVTLTIPNADIPVAPRDVSFEQPYETSPAGRQLWLTGAHQRPEVLHHLVHERLLEHSATTSQSSHIAERQLVKFWLSRT